MVLQMIEEQLLAESFLHKRILKLCLKFSEKAEKLQQDEKISEATDIYQSIKLFIIPQNFPIYLRYAIFLKIQKNNEQAKQHFETIKQQINNTRQIKTVCLYYLHYMEILRQMDQNEEANELLNEWLQREYQERIPIKYLILGFDQLQDGEKSETIALNYLKNSKNCFNDEQFWQIIAKLFPACQESHNQNRIQGYLLQKIQSQAGVQQILHLGQILGNLGLERFSNLCLLKYLFRDDFCKFTWKQIQEVSQFMINTAVTLQYKKMCLLRRIQNVQTEILCKNCQEKNKLLYHRLVQEIIACKKCPQCPKSQNAQKFFEEAYLR